MEFDIHEIIYKDNCAILIGIVCSGKLRTHSKCYLGPDAYGNFYNILPEFEFDVHQNNY